MRIKCIDKLIKYVKRVKQVVQFDGFAIRFRIAFVALAMLCGRVTDFLFDFESTILINAPNTIIFTVGFGEDSMRMNCLR